MLHLRKNILNINRNEPILLSPKAKGTEYETFMFISRKKFKAYHAKLIEYLSRNGVRCYVEYYESVFSQTDILSLIQKYTKHTSKKVLDKSRYYVESCEAVFLKPEIFILIQKDLQDTLKKVMQSRINLMHCFDFKELDLLEEYLIGQYGNHTDLIKQIIKEKKENRKRDLNETFGELFVTQKMLEDVLELSNSVSLYLLNLYVNVSNHHNDIILKAIQRFRNAGMNLERADELINLTTMLNAENVLEGLLLKEVQHQKAIRLKTLQHVKAAVYHHLRETQIFMIEMIDSSDTLDKHACALLNITIKATEEAKHLMSHPLAVYDNLDKLSIKVKAKEYVKLTVKSKISDKFEMLDMLYQDLSNRTNKVNQLMRNAEDPVNRLNVYLGKFTEQMDTRDYMNESDYMNISDYFGDAIDSCSLFLWFWIYISIW